MTSFARCLLPLSLVALTACGRGKGGGDGAGDAGPGDLQVRCNKAPIARRLEPTERDATPHAALLSFVATHRAKHKEEAMPPPADFKKHGGEDDPVYVATKGTRVVARVQIEPNTKPMLKGGGGFYVSEYAVCPADD